MPLLAASGPGFVQQRVPHANAVFEEHAENLVGLLLRAAVLHPEPKVPHVIVVPLRGHQAVTRALDDARVLRWQVLRRPLRIVTPMLHDVCSITLGEFRLEALLLLLLMDSGVLQVGPHLGRAAVDGLCWTLQRGAARASALQFPGGHGLRSRVTCAGAPEPRGMLGLQGSEVRANVLRPQRRLPPADAGARQGRQLVQLPACHRRPPADCAWALGLT
mmetsp:Transcript_36511/g.96627  ORF Transcript_36511/g.96627 Transcript_36511/m.96627 type:complete len:218 (+) Transcript_36511:1865-2518(+)